MFLRVIIALFVLTLLASCNQDFIAYTKTADDVPEEEKRLEEEPIKPEIPFSDEEIDAKLKELMETKAKSYRIGPSDKFSFNVYGELDLEVKDVVVRADGFITLNLIGDIKVEGLSIPEATEMIDRKYSEFLKEPRTSLIPLEMGSGSFTILGKVNYPGSYLIERELRVVDAIAMAGGLGTGRFRDNTVELANLENAFMVRGDNVLPINFYSLVKKGDSRYNIPLMPGDYINIPSTRSQEVYVSGEVKEPDAYGFSDGLTLTKLLAYAQGLTVGARENELRIIRGSLANPKVYTVNLAKIRSGELVDFKMEPGDILYAPRKPLTNWNIFINEVLPSFNAISTTSEALRSTYR